ncbi:sodium/potassium-transporting ATPase subunit beta-3-like [Protopterus annectens]|uniref:sodium/potassium-transporting ATPase subunit beta-3-like n=1 Tax=Protopterus annectens TaxID=7888 RepID=UPI001CFAEE3F|nr:sodium/potassium-transporting ATPase subunit beta-3-like [Protopterus annectens]
MAIKEEKKPFNQTLTEWRQFFYNPQNGQFMGRTASSWGLILLFYLVFYGFLAGLFTLTLWVMLQTLDDEIPKYRDRISSPGLTIWPRPDSAMEMKFNLSDPRSYSSYTDALADFLKEYENKQNRNIACEPGSFFIQDDRKEKAACLFNRSLLGECSGLNDTDYGYSTGSPCVLVKMNRIIGLKPNGQPTVNCTYKTETDDRLQFKYFPEGGTFDLMYFPYYGRKVQPTYVQPLVGVKLLIGNNRKDISIECKIEGSPSVKNSDDRDKFLGRVAFKVTVIE